MGNFLDKIFAGIDRTINGIDRRTRESIAQGMKLLATVLVIASIITGIVLGRKAATIRGIQLIQNTNDVFEIDLKRNRERPGMGTMVERDNITEGTAPGLRRLLFPQHPLTPELQENIIEPAQQEASKPGTPAPSDTPPGLAEAPATDDALPQTDVRALKRSERSSPPTPVPDTVGEGERPLPLPGQGTVKRTPPETAPADTAPARPRRGIIQKRQPLPPMEGARGIVE